MKKKKSVFIGVLCACFCVVLGVAGGIIINNAVSNNNQNSSNSGNIGHNDEKTATELFNELTELENDDSADQVEEYDVNKLVNSYSDCDSDFSFNIISPYQLDNANDYLTIVDQSGANVGFSIDQIGVSYEYTINPVVPWAAGEIYEANLLDDSIVFKDKDDSIRSIHFNIKRESINEVELNKDNISFYPLKDVVAFNESNYYIVYKKPIFLERGDIFCLSESQNVTKDSFIAAFEKCEAFGSYYKITFSDPDLADVFSSLDFCKESQVQFGDNLVFEDPNVIANYIADSASIQNVIYDSVAQYYPIQRLNFVETLKRYLKIDVKFENTSTSIKISIVLSCRFLVNKDKNYIGVKLLYSNCVSLVIKSDISLQTGWFGIPTGIKANIEVKRVADTTWSLAVSYGNSYDQEEETSEEAKKHIEESLAKIKNREAHSFEEILPDYNESKVEENKLEFNFAKFHIFPFPPAPIVITFTVGLELKFDFYGEVNVSFKKHTEDVVGSYSTSSGFGKYSSPNKVEENIHDITLRAKVETEANLFLKIGFSIYGLEWFFELSLNAKLGVYTDISGFCSFTWKNDHSQNNGEGNENEHFDSTFEFSGGFSIESGLKFAITGKIKIAFFETEITLFEVKLPFKIAAKGTLFFGFEKGKLTKFDITSTEAENVFEATGLAVDWFTIDDLKVHRIQYFFDKPNPNPHVGAYTCFEIVISKGQEYFYIEDDGDIVIKDNCPLTWEGEYKIVYNDGTLRVESEVYTISYKDERVHYISFDDTEPSIAFIGDVIELPTMADTDGKTFLGWKIEGSNKIYPGGSSYTIPNHDVHFVSVWEDVKFFTVNFYNGRNVLISSQKVKRGEDAIEPSEEERAVEGYEFISWDRDFTNVNGDINVFGIYVKVS